MGHLFAFRTEREPWGGTTGRFLFPVTASLAHIKNISSKLGEKFQDIIDNCWPGRGISLYRTSLEEEKQILEALKLGYQDCSNNPEYWIDTFFRDPEPFILCLEKYKELIQLMEEEVNDIERGKLIIQEDGMAIINENFKEE